MKRAILSDIHGNAEALAAVLADIETQDVDEIYCLGDIVTYGPNPRECLERAMAWTLCLLGGDDLAVRATLAGAVPDPRLSGPDERYVAWAASQLQIGPPSTVERRRRFLDRLEPVANERGVSFGHGSPHAPTSEYLFPEDVYNGRKMKLVFQSVDRCAYQGRSHIAGIFTEGNQFLTPEDCGGEYQLPAEKTIVSVGSVGQPGDGDARACYVVATGSSVQFRRIPYDFDETIRKLNRRL